MGLTRESARVLARINLWAELGRGDRRYAGNGQPHSGLPGQRYALRPVGGRLAELACEGCVC